MTGAVVWMTGLPASGKSTLAAHLRARLAPHRPCVVLDSDEIRAALGVLTYGGDARDAFYAGLGALAAVLARQGLVVVVAATAPRQAHRDHARAAAPAFVEVWVRTPRAVCEARDPKRLYARARTGDPALRTLPGVGAPYEPPTAPDVIADGGTDDAALAVLLARLAPTPAIG